MFPRVVTVITKEWPCGLEAFRCHPVSLSCTIDRQIVAVATQIYGKVSGDGKETHNFIIYISYSAAIYNYILSVCFSGNGWK